MRKLCITRKGSLWGWAKKLSVYISDAENGEIDICKIPCRKLGEVENDSTAIFEIDEERRRVFVIAGKRTRHLCNDSMHIHEGKENVEISGKRKFNPGRFHAFYFDGEPDVLAKRNIEDGNRNGWLLLGGIAVVVALAVLLGFSIDYSNLPNLFV